VQLHGAQSATFRARGIFLLPNIFPPLRQIREGFLQVQLARITYQLPRQTRLWSHLDRQGGGGAVKGMGESQLEIDKRLLKEQASRIRERLERVRTHRAIHRSRRADTSVPVLAVVGYTSAGKSTLLNRLTDEKTDVLTDASLFSTLDPTTRRALRPGGAPVLITDTVGFCSKLPTQLVAAFRATLEEVAEATVVVHVVDASRANFLPFVATVDAILSSIEGADAISRLIVWNKIDLLPEAVQQLLRARADLERVPTVCMSAATGEGVSEFWEAISQLEELCALKAVIPWGHIDVLTQVRQLGEITREEFLEEGIRIEANVTLRVARRLAPWRTA